MYVFNGLRQCALVLGHELFTGSNPVEEITFFMDIGQCMRLMYNQLREESREVRMDPGKKN